MAAAGFLVFIIVLAILKAGGNCDPSLLGTGMRQIIILIVLAILGEKINCKEDND